MPVFHIEGAGSRVVVSARSSIHDTKTVWDSVSGTVTADPADLAAGADADLTVDMTRYDAGDFLKNRKLRKDLELERHPTARYRLDRLALNASDAAGVGGAATGTLSWRGRDLELTTPGTARVDAAGFSAVARFELDVRRLGVTPPRFLMFKVEDVVAVEVTLEGRARAP